MVRVRQCFAVWAVAVLVAVGITGCAGLLGGRVVDGAGMTKQQVEKMTAKQQFDLFGKRYVHMQEMFTEAQRAISTDTWTWGAKGFGADGGTSSNWAMQGATAENSYFIDTSRLIKLPGAKGDKADAEPIINYFNSKGWETTIEKTQTNDYIVKASTSESQYEFYYTIQPTGWYVLELVSRVFWGDTDRLAANVSGRISRKEAAIEQSKPGYWIPFPKWSDPVVDP